MRSSALRGGRLTLRVRSGSPTEVTLTQQDRAATDVGILTFERDTLGNVTGFSLQAGRVRNLRFVRQ